MLEAKDFTFLSDYSSYSGLRICPWCESVIAPYGVDKHIEFHKIVINLMEFRKRDDDCT